MKHDSGEPLFRATELAGAAGGAGSRPAWRDTVRRLLGPRRPMADRLSPDGAVGSAIGLESSMARRLPISDRVRLRPPGQDDCG